MKNKFVTISRIDLYVNPVDVTGLILLPPPPPPLPSLFKEKFQLTALASLREFYYGGDALIPATDSRQHIFGCR